MESIKTLPAIVHLSFSGDFGGREKVAASLSKGLGDAGYHCCLYMVVEERKGLDRNKNLVNALHEIDAPCQFFKSDRRFSWRLLRELQASLVKNKVGIIHCHCYRSLFYAHLMRLLKMIDVSIFYTFHGLFLNAGLGSRLIRATQEIGFRLCDGVIGCSRANLDLSVPKNWNGPKTVIINAIDVEYDAYSEILERKKAAREALIETYQLDAAKPIVINVGRLCAEKDFSLYLRMIQSLVSREDQRGDANYLVVGNGELETQLTREAHDLGIEKNVVFTGFVSDMATIFLGADFIVQTSFWEGTPLCLLEAQSYGLPSVAPNVGGNSDIFDDGVNGRLYDVGNMEQLEDAVIAYLNDAAAREQCGRQAHMKVKTEFSIEQWVEQHVRFYLDKSKVKNLIGEPRI